MVEVHEFGNFRFVRKIETETQDKTRQVHGENCRLRLDPVREQTRLELFMNKKGREPWLHVKKRGRGESTTETTKGGLAEVTAQQRQRQHA